MRHLFLLTALAAASPAIAETPLETVEATAPAPAEGGFLAEIQGRWVVTLDEAQLRQLLLMQVAVAETPPTKKQLKKLAMTDEEQTSFAMLAAMVKEMEPTDPDLVRMRQVAAGADQATIAFHDGQLTRAVPGLEMTAPYQVIADGPDSATIEFSQEGEPGKQWTVRRDGDGIVAGGEQDLVVHYNRAP